MKLRIKENTIRFRLSQSEIKEIEMGSVEDKTLFPGGSTFTYRIERGKVFDALFENGIIIKVPEVLLRSWTNSDQVGISESIILRDNSKLEITLEKDYQCLTERPKEDESDLFPNPLEKHSNS